MHDDLTRTFNAADQLRQACDKHAIRLNLLVAETALWASPVVHAQLVDENGTGCWFPNYRRHRPGQGEKRGEIRDGIYLDDNSYANQALKKAIGVALDQVVGYEVCHIWPGSCYDANCHTSIANLVLLPRALAALSDHEPSTRSALQFRAFELYGWHPAGESPPERLIDYPENWRPPFPFTHRVQDHLRKRRRAETMPARQDAVRAPIAETVQLPAPRSATPMTSSADDSALVLRRLPGWAAKPQSVVHRTIAIVLEHGAARPLTRTELVRLIGECTDSKNPYGVVANLLRSDGNAYGRLLVETDGFLTIHPEVVDEVKRHRWSAE